MIPRDSLPATIRRLPELVRNQIAAGEVVERPASIVKELLENALDAGARSVRVELEEGGSRLVRVTDDGLGMSAEDLALAFEPHATSKLGDAADLDHIATLGFRGEALASIGSVARCKIFSRQRGEALGAVVKNAGGDVGSIQESGGPEGTVVEVKDLFFNTPARRRFQKRVSTELSHCLDIAQRLALAHEGVGFQVLHDGRRVLDVEAGMDLRGRIRRAFGAELERDLVEVSAADGSTRLHGYLAPPRFAKRDTSRQMWFLNGRPLRDRILLRCLKEAYRGFLDPARQPVAFLSLALDPASVDVNVHPKKNEVRFREDRRIFGFLLNALREAVRGSDMSTPGADLVDRARSRPGGGPTLPDPGALMGLGRPERDELAVYEVPVSPSAAPAGSGPVRAPEDSRDETAGSPWAQRDEFLGPFLQVDRTYIVRALPDGFEVLDQHALHERLTYEELREEVRAGRVEVQRRLIPELVELGAADVARLEAHLPALEGIGLLFAAFGPTTIAVHGLPARFRDADAEELVRDALQVVKRKGKVPEREELLEELLHSRACRSSVMAGDELTDAEISALLARAAHLSSDQTCPHGRPTRVRFRLEDLERAFERR